MFILLIFLIISLAATLTLLFSVMSPSKKQMILKKYLFECGFNSNSLNKASFSVNFFMIIILFLIFDTEISFIMPMIISNKQLNIAPMMFLNLMIVLTIPLINEWINGFIEWTK